MFWAMTKRKAVIRIFFPKQISVEGFGSKGVLFITVYGHFDVFYVALICTGHLFP